MAHTKHVTLVATTVATVTLEDSKPEKVWVHNRHATAEAFATTDGTTPTVGGDDTHLIKANSVTVLKVPAGAVSVKLISSATPTITVSTRPAVTS